MRSSASLLGIVGLSVTLMGGCGYDNGPEYRYVDSSGQQNETIYSANIDADATMADVVAGEGVGMFIEYATGGTWRVKFTCDTKVTQLDCFWQIDALTVDGSPIGGIDVQQLGGQDTVKRDPKDSGTILYDGLTTTEIDQFTFQANPEVPVGFNVWLEGELEPNRFVFWIGDGWLNRGMSGPFFDLYPVVTQK